MDEERLNSVVLADIYEPHIEDVQTYLREVEVLDAALRDAAGPLREQMLADRYILPHSSLSTGSPLASVDSSSINLSSGDVCTVLALAVRYSETQDVAFASSRKTGPNNEGFRHMANAMRLKVELELLSSASTITVADHSFWSLLMEANKVITSYEDLSEDQGKDDLEEIYNVCFKNEKLFMSALRNLNIVAMSKISATKAFTSDKSPYSKFFNGARISDRAICSVILEEGEFTKPRVISHMTDGRFGIERRGFSEKDQREIEYKFKYQDGGLMVFYYRPWAFQPAYRIEFQERRFCTHDDLSDLMDTIRRETSCRMIREPMPQFMADRICQQVHPLGMLYGHAHRTRFPHLLFANRTSEI